MATQYPITGKSASEIATSVEDGVRAGGLPSGTRLPAVRTLAVRLGVSPGTVAAAYGTLRRRGIVATGGRRGTHVLPRPAIAPRSPSRLPVPPGARDLSTGEPDVELLPPLGPRLHDLAPPPVTYRTGGLLPAFAEAAAARLAHDGVPARHVTATSGGLDGIERVLATRLVSGDVVAVEDPGWSALLDLLAGMNLRPLPVPVDDEGPSVSGVERALRAGAAALVVTSRAQNPTGASVGATRAEELRALLGAFEARARPTGMPGGTAGAGSSGSGGSGSGAGTPRTNRGTSTGTAGAGSPPVEGTAAGHGVNPAGRQGGLLLIEDDHAAELAAEPLHTLAGATHSWAFVRSVSKPYGPDLRCAVLAADEETLARVEGRQVLAARWVSTVLQSLVVALWSSPETGALIERAGRSYDERRQALLDALAARGVTAHGRTGLNIWLPVDDETTACARLLEAGWVVAPGRRFRIAGPPGIRLTISTLRSQDVAPLADALTAALQPADTRPFV